MDGDQVVTDSIQSERLSIGIGCSPRADSEDIVRLVKASLDPIPLDTILATVDRRASMGEVVASILGLQLVLFPASVLLMLWKRPHWLRCLRELRVHIGIEFLFGHGAIVVGVHCSQPLLPSSEAAGRFLTRSVWRDANNCSDRQNCTGCPRKSSIAVQGSPPD